MTEGAVVTERWLRGIVTGFAILTVGLVGTFYLLVREIDNRTEAVRMEAATRAEALNRQTIRIAARLERERGRHATLLCNESVERYQDLQKILRLFTQEQAGDDNSTLRQRAVGLLDRPECAT